MASRVLLRLTRAALLAGVVGVAFASSAQARPAVRPTARPRAARGFNLFSGAVNVVVNVNRIQCNINNVGETCVDPTNSPVVGGGFWPKGSPDQYIFNAGLQIAGFVPANAGFAWAGDTVGAFFFDPRGDQAMGEGRTNVFNSLVTDDLNNWPTAAYANDTSLFATSLIGRANVSQQDTWSRFWDGNSGLAPSARKHPMGILVEQRGMAWNFPSGNEDILYFITRFINITSGNLADYQGLSAYGYSAQDITDIYNIALDFRSRSQASFNVTIPAGGFSWTNVYASFAEDPDVGQAGSNYSVGNLIFNLVAAYKSDFKEPTWQLPPNIFAAPFAAAPGFEAAKYLATPGNLGIVMSGNTTNGAPFPDAVGVSRLWRNLSGNLLPSDGSCSVPNPQARRFCFWGQNPVDTRMFASSGPFSVAPGQLATSVVAIVQAASMASTPAFSPPYGAIIPAWSLAPFIGTAAGLVPGFPIEGTRLYGNVTNQAGFGADTLRNFDHATGFLGYSADVNANQSIDQAEVVTQPRSLLGKSLVAQAVFNAKFLLPFAPEVPNYFLIPGDNQVTVAWAKSRTEDPLVGGDPFFTVASQPLIGGVANPLYDPNFRKFDVEGYRIWRGRTQSEMTVVASFDYAGTAISDYTAEFFDGAVDGNQCAPELGVQASCTDGAGNALTYATVNITPASPHKLVSLSGNIQQIPAGGRVQLANGTIFNVVVDTAITGGATGLPGLADTGVPFAFVDHGVRNGFRYYYAVTAFDINSLKSGPSSLESPLVTRTVTPRVPSGQETAGALGTPTLTSAAGTPLTQGNMPAIDATTGQFAGPIPPTDGFSIGFAAFLPQVLPGTSGSMTVTVDSIVPGTAAGQIDFTVVANGAYWLTAQGAGAPVKFQIPVLNDCCSTNYTKGAAFPATAMDQTQAGRFGGDSTFALYGNFAISTPGAWRLTSWGRGQANSNPANSSVNGPRWWTGGANENTADPNKAVCTPSAGTCFNGGQTPSITHYSAGSLGAGVSMWHIQSYSTVQSVPMRDLETITDFVTRAADFKVYWGAAGKIDSVVDVTHGVPVRFDTIIRASWGILNDSSFVGVAQASTPDGNNNLLTWSDIFCVSPVPASVPRCGAGGAHFQNHARLTPIADTSSSFAGTAALTTTGNGFIFYLNGHFFPMQMAALPAAGTVWNARFYSGSVVGTTGTYSFVGAIRPPAVPGLRIQIPYVGTALNVAATNDTVLATVHTVPDPYYVTNSLEQTANTKILRFVNLPAQAIIRIYSASGILVNVLSHNDATGGSEQVWNLRNRNNQFVASGVYFFHVETPDGHTKIGRFTVVNYAQ
jgi:hypothetical protein